MTDELNCLVVASCAVDSLVRSIYVMYDYIQHFVHPVIKFGQCCPVLFLLCSILLISICLFVPFLVSRFDGVIVSVLVSSALYLGFRSPIHPNAMKLVFVASPMSTHYLGPRVKIGLHGIQIMYPSGATCLIRIIELAL